jgi:hypothetical protein
MTKEKRQALGQAGKAGQAVQTPLFFLRSNQKRAFLPQSPLINSPE